MFECPTCKQSCKRLIGIDGHIYCNICYQRKDERPTYLHQIMPGSEAGVTFAKGKIIDNRIICPDDKRTVIDRRTGKITEF